jgi:hypothetical protein
VVEEGQDGFRKLLESFQDREEVSGKQKKNNHNMIRPQSQLID